MPSRRSVVLGGAALALAAGVGAAAVDFRGTLRAARAASDPALSRIVETRHGPLEYAEAGGGPPFLMIHGTGGGFDQGLLFARRLVGLGYRVIAPSRFGYLRSAFPPDPGARAQAESLADLLDALGLGAVAVAGGSAGAIPALAFALAFPDRTAALIPIVPAAYVPGRPLPEPWTPLQRRVAEAALASDLLFWAAIRAAPDTLTSALLATDPALVHTAAPQEQARARAILRGILPVSARFRGLMNDAAETGRPAAVDYAAIRAPTLAISVEDDRFGTAANARHIAATVPGAELIVYPSGGHIWVGRDAELFSAVDAFLRRRGGG
jgi:pimeloyl-ACP methyl ester carboxylesterase